MRRFYSGAGVFAFSLLVHGSLMVSLDGLVAGTQTKIAELNKQLKRQHAKEEEKYFEYVESPKTPASEKPNPESPRVSDHDALNQDLVSDKSQAERSPAAQMLGPSDQLAQKQTSVRQEAQPAVQPKPASQDSAESESVGDKNIVREAVMKEVETPDTDKITTQEMSRRKSHAAELFGVTSFEATGSGMGEYMKRLKEKIWLVWFPYLTFQYPQDFRGADAILSITLDAKGDVKIVQVIEQSGSPVFASYCVEALQRASNFGPVPKEILALIGKDVLELKFGFHYR